MSIADWQPCVALIKDIVTTFAAIIAGCVAIAGLGAWRKQLAGKAEYEAARRLLKATFALREAINIVRAPYMSPGEIAQAMRRAGIDRLHAGFKTPPEAIRAVYQERWSYVREAMASLAAEAFEAEVLWGASVQTLLKPLHSCVAELYGALQIHLSSNSTDRPSMQSYEERKSIEAMVYSTNNPDSDELYAEVLDAIADIEQFVKPYIKSGLVSSRTRTK